MLNKLKEIRTIYNKNQPKIKSWTKLGGQFLIGQVSVQFIQLLSGFFLIRWLSITEYAQYSMAFAFQSTAQSLVEFGFSGSIIALVGNRINNKRVIGEYIKAGKFYRNRFFIFVAIGVSVIFPLMARKYDWSITISILLLLSILSNLFFSGNITYYSTPLKIHKKLRPIYGTQVSLGTLRLLINAIFYFLTLLNSWVAAFSNSIVVLATGLVYKKKAIEYIEEPLEASLVVRKEMFQYIKPIIPGIIFASLQAQLMVFLISIFGKSDSNIAEVSALGKFGLLFTVLTMSGSILIAPYFAKQNKENIIVKYLGILGAFTVIIISIIILGYFYSNLFLWFLGKGYEHLNKELVLLLTLSGLQVINGIMWNMNASRKWIYNWMPMLSIPGTIIIQIIGIITMDLSTTYNVLLFSLFSTLFGLLTRIIVALVGFKKDKII